MKVSGTIVRALTVIAAVIAIALAGSASVSAQEKVLVCHAAGQDGTTKYVTISVPPNDGGFPQGHFTEDGTTAAGHEDDYLGACQEDEPSPTPTTEPSPSVTPTVEPTPTVTPTPTSTPTPTASATPTSTPTATPTTAPTPTPRAPMPQLTMPPTDTAAAADTVVGRGHPALLILAAIFAAVTAVTLLRPERRR